MITEQLRGNTGVKDCNWRGKRKREARGQRTARHHTRRKMLIFQWVRGKVNYSEHSFSSCGVALGIHLSSSFVQRLMHQDSLHAHQDVITIQ